MKKFILLSFLSFSIVSIALAQQAPLNAKQQNLRSLEILQKQQKLKNELKKKESLNKSDNFIIKGADQLASEAEQSKTKKKGAK